MKYRASEIFVPGGMPFHTYVPRAERKLEDRLQASNDNLCKLVTVTGTTKSGKTVLVKRIFPRNESVWVDGGAVRTEDDFWSYILNEIDGYTAMHVTQSQNSVEVLSSTVEGEVGVPLTAKLAGTVTGSHEKGEGQTHSKALSLSPRAAAISQLQRTRIPVVIDDFHYLDRGFQGGIIRALKPLVFEGIPIILIAIPHRRYDAVKVEREMTGRLEPIEVPTWEADELSVIPGIGFPLLNIQLAQSITPKLVGEAYGSPHLMQEFCRTLARENNISETTDVESLVEDFPDSLFGAVAEQTGKVVYDKLAKGPRQRSDRLQRQLKNGKTADIYKVTLMALANLKPGLEEVNYETLRSSMRDVLAENLPQAHEVSRVLEQMSQIALSDEASTPVLDWEKDERKLHITDPFFAFYLKWGVDLRTH